MTIRKVLIVDDMPAELENIKHIVSDAGYETVSASSGKDALEKVEKFKPDLIFMDVVMPEMDGFAACRALHNGAASKDIPVIIVSSKDQEADKVWAQLQGASAYITKPYSAEQIVRQLSLY